MERDFLGLASKLSPIVTVKKETNDDSAPTRFMMDWSFLSNSGSPPQLLSFGPSQQNRRRDLVNDHMFPSPVFTSTSIADQHQTNHYNSVQEVRMFPNFSHQDQKTFTASMSEPRSQSFINSFINHQHLGRSPYMAPPVSVFPTPTTNINRSSSNHTDSSSATQLTIFYAGSVSVYQDITPEKAQAIMLLARNEPQAEPVNHSPATTYPSTRPPTFYPFISYSVSQTANVSNEVIGLEPIRPLVSLESTHNNQTDAFIMAPTVGLPQTRKASLARFLEKRKERVINVSPYNLDNKSSIDHKTPMSGCVSSPSAHHLQ